MIMISCSSSYRPLTFSEELTELAHKIDFENELDQSSEAVEEKPHHMEVDKDEKDEPSQEQWPWEAVRNKLR